METAQCPLTDEWINKVQYVHKIGYNLAIKGNEILIHGTTWKSFKTVC